MDDTVILVDYCVMLVYHNALLMDWVEYRITLVEQSAFVIKV